MRKRQTGFTLIEIAIVLVIIGLLLGGVLKGQELIQNARVRNIIAQQDGIKAAYFGFQDRYRGIPGDYSSTNAAANIPGAGSNCGGDGNSLIDSDDESACAWYQMSKAGFISGNYSGKKTAGTPPFDSSNSPVNPYGGILQLIFDDVYEGSGATSGTGGTSGTSGTKVHNIKSGTNIPATVLSEVDRKIDDGTPGTGSFRFSTWQGSLSSNCESGGGSSPTTWAITSTATQCGGVSLF